jgi:hypothetical protein
MHDVLLAALVLHDREPERATMSKRARRERRRAKRLLERRDRARELHRLARAQILELNEHIERVLGELAP